MDSTVLPTNLAGGVPTDLFFDVAVSITGRDNLVFAISPSTGRPAPDGFTLPAGTCPLLGPLRSDGSEGALQTHALLSGSPALSKGDNSQNFKFDQRGEGFPRTSQGAFGFVFTDIGAYEL
jgi:hypothetical protein